MHREEITVVTLLAVVAVLGFCAVASAYVCPDSMNTCIARSCTVPPQMYYYEWVGCVQEYQYGLPVACQHYVAELVATCPAPPYDKCTLGYYMAEYYTYCD